VEAALQLLLLTKVVMGPPRLGILAVRTSPLRAAVAVLVKPTLVRALVMAVVAVVVAGQTRRRV
jgi:hypothetical protein